LGYETTIPFRGFALSILFNESISALRGFFPGLASHIASGDNPIDMDFTHLKGDKKP
jgi:hypothetical protein